MDSLFSSVVTYIAIPIYVFNVLGNLLVIVIIQKNKKLRESPNNFLLHSLSTADLWFSVLVFANVVFVSKNAFLVSVEFSFNALCTIYILVTLSMERYFAILKPFVHTRKVTKSLLRKLVYATYVMAAVLSAPGYYIAFERKSFEKARENNTTKIAPAWFETFSSTYTFALFILGFILPTAGVVFSYSRVIYHAWFKADPKTNTALLKARRKLTSLFILVTVVFITTWTPIFAGMFVRRYHAHDQRNLKFELLSMLVALVGSAANPVIYSLRCPKFRQEVAKLFNCSRYRPKLHPQLPPL